MLKLLLTQTFSFWNIGPVSKEMFHQIRGLFLFCFTVEQSNIPIRKVIGNDWKQRKKMFFQVVESFFKTTLRKRKVQRFHFYVCVCAIHRRSIDPKMKATKNKRVELSNQSPHTASHFYFQLRSILFFQSAFSKHPSLCFSKEYQIISFL